MAKAQAEEATTEAPEVATTEAAAERPVKDVVREMFDAGKSRSEIAKALGITYQRVFSLTKGKSNAATEAGGGARPKVILEGLEGPLAVWNGKPRIEAIRELYTNGGTAADGTAIPAGKPGPISKALGTSYQIVFQATRSLRDGQAATEEPEGTEVEEGETETPDVESDEAGPEDEVEG